MGSRVPEGMTREQFVSLVENAPDSIAIVDRQHRVVFANHQLASANPIAVGSLASHVVVKDSVVVNAAAEGISANGESIRKNGSSLLRSMKSMQRSASKSVRH